jgi:hypothetical protein
MEEGTPCVSESESSKQLMARLRDNEAWQILRELYDTAEPDDTFVEPDEIP